MESLGVAVSVCVAGHAKRVETRVGAPGLAVVDLYGVDLGCRGALGGSLVGGGLLMLGGRQGESAAGEDAQEGDEGDGGLLGWRS